jgi:antitoxin ParD1/3/4
VSNLDTYEHTWHGQVMNVRLGKFEAWVQERVDSGDYSSQAEVIRAGLRLLKEEEQWRTDARKQIAEGLADLRAGRSLEGDDVLEQLMKSIADKRRKGA